MPCHCPATRTPGYFRDQLRTSIPSTVPKLEYEPNCQPQTKRTEFFKVMMRQNLGSSSTRMSALALGETIERSPLFHHRPLDTSRREIRLLVLHPAEDILDVFGYSCTLVHVSVDEDPDYEALSYVWGSKANKQKILIDGRQLEVTSNLAEALNHLYDCDTPRKLWVDAICINQEDISERSHQVQSMTEIYARARNVVVWMGVLGIATQNFLHHVENSEDDDQTPEHLRRWTASGTRIPGNTSAFNEEDLEVLSEVAQNPWFKRVWVVQEVAVAREVIVQTGRTTISWSAFCTALEKYVDKHEMKSVIEAASTINTIRTARTQKPYYMDLFILLERFRHCLATDERDKVFALLGLASSSLAQEKVVRVTPDYSKPAIDVFKSLALQYISKRKNLDIICHASLGNHVPIPSWAPSWSWYDRGLSVLPKRRILNARHEPMYRCCGNLELDRELLFGTELSGNRLWLNGFKFDVVSVIGRVATKAEDLGLELPIDGATDLLKKWRSMSEICSQTYGSNLEEDFRRTLLADALGEKRYQIQSAVTANETDGKAKQSSSKINLSDASVRRAAMKRAFFVTEKGYMGLGPSSMVEGDLVYVLSGGQVPFILRPTISAEGFALVGESYIHGIMDGEATILGIEIETFYLI
ncbi:Heterokaryon incompatibility protein [Rutstroemia sp. NJR-2017a WRK4]|nr:Heterokaryon incompatibility protein [Rutstroemia sp. NJR-2017a WRK4]